MGVFILAFYRRTNFSFNYIAVFVVTSYSYSHLFTVLVDCISISTLNCYADLKISCNFARHQFIMIIIINIIVIIIRLYPSYNPHKLTQSPLGQGVPCTCMNAIHQRRSRTPKHNRTRSKGSFTFFSSNNVKFAGLDEFCCLYLCSSGHLLPSVRSVPAPKLTCHLIPCDDTTA